MENKEEFSQDFKDRLLAILQKVLVDKGTLSDSDAVVYFHWARHKDDQCYSFVPERYRKL